jgi:hypothetical protein
MVLTIELPPELEETVRRRAEQSGQDVKEFVIRAVQEKIAKSRTFDEICEPFAQAVRDSGVSDKEFDDFFEEAREEIWREKQSRRP